MQNSQNGTKPVHPVHYRYFTEQNLVDLQTAGGNLKKLSAIAIDVLGRMSAHVHFVSGPISSGGLGNAARNLEAFRLTVEYLADQGLDVFSQIPFESGMRIYYAEWQRTAGPDTYPWEILFEFYEPVFDRLTSATFHFMFDFQTSIGANWEHNYCVRRRFVRRYLSRDLTLSVSRGDRVSV